MPDNQEPQERRLNAPPPESVEKIYADGVAMVQLLGPQDRLLQERRKLQLAQRLAGGAGA